MSSAQIVFQVYLLMSTLLSGADVMHQSHCFTTEQKLFAIDAYAHYEADVDSYYDFVHDRQECILNNTPWYHMSLVNITNVSNGTFVPEFDRYKLQIAIDSDGKFK